MISIHHLNQKVNSLDQKINSLEHKLDIILQRLDEQKPIQERLDHHITFIESVYARLKGAINYLSWFGPKKAEPLEHDTHDMLKII